MTNVAPVAADDSHSVTAGTTLTVSASGILSNDTDADGDDLTAVSVSYSGGGSLAVNADGSFNYTPAPGFSGPDSFTYQAFDGFENSNEATVTITVVAPPTAVDDAYSVQHDQPLNVDAYGGVLANDSGASQRAGQRRGDNQPRWHDSLHAQQRIQRFRFVHVHSDRRP